MRGNPEFSELIAARDLAHALHEISSAPGEWTPIAGGTELMVAHAAGRLQAKKLISLWALPELHVMQMSQDWLTIGAGVTFGQLRQDKFVAEYFPLLAQAAGWIGSIANQNRATIAGNIVNGSPAADAPPALLVYDAEIELISQQGTRRIPYVDFHLGYKQNVLRQDELVLALHLPRRYANHVQYLRKVGARKAMAITKIALAATALIEPNLEMRSVRLALASFADRPIRATNTERILEGQQLTPGIRQAARRSLISEARSIDDIRSTADYRRAVAANLLDEFLDRLKASVSLGDDQ